MMRCGCGCVWPLRPLCAAAQAVRRNLARVNEEAIDFDLLEELLAHVHDDPQHDGAVLVFLPGKCPELAAAFLLLVPK